MAVGRRGNLLSDSRTNDVVVLVAGAAVEQLCNNFRPNYLTLRKLFKLFSKQLQLPWSHFACCRAQHDKLAQPATEANQSGELMVLWGCAVSRCFIEEGKLFRFTSSDSPRGRTRRTLGEYHQSCVSSMCSPSSTG